MTAYCWSDGKLYHHAFPSDSIC